MPPVTRPLKLASANKNRTPEHGCSEFVVGKVRETLSDDFEVAGLFC